jgi:hypothetical protein
MIDIFLPDRMLKRGFIRCDQIRISPRPIVRVSSRSRQTIARTFGHDGRGIPWPRERGSRFIGPASPNHASKFAVPRKCRRECGFEFRQRQNRPSCEPRYLAIRTGARHPLGERDFFPAVVPRESQSAPPGPDLTGTVSIFHHAVTGRSLPTGVVQPTYD